MNASPPVSPLIDAGRLKVACLQAVGDDAVTKDALAPSADDIRFVDEIGSTNESLMSAPFGPGAAPARLLVAWRQVAGRGRRGRVWNSEPAASLTFSIAFERIAPAMPPVGWSIVAGVTIAETLCELVPDIGLKWPNDLQRQGRKCGGILAESKRQVGASQPLERVVTGIGLNLLPDPQRDERAGQPTIALFDSTPAIEREALLARVFAALCRQWRLFNAQGLAELPQRWSRFDALRDLEVAVIDNGQTLYTGIASGIDDSGALLVARGGQRQAVTVGDVSVRRVV